MIGTAIIRYDHLSGSFRLCLLYVQLANIFFAIGQVGYKKMMEVYPIPQQQVFSWFYIGACIVAVLSWFIFGDAIKLLTTKIQWVALLWLGVGASGIGCFMWNYRATQVDAGTLAIMNNMLVPAGLLVNFVLWQHHSDWISFSMGSSLLLLSLWVHQHWLYRSTLASQIERLLLVQGEEIAPQNKHNCPF